MMKICYVLDFSILKVDGPTINEFTFLKTLKNQTLVDVCYFINSDNAEIINGKTQNVCMFEDYQAKPIRFLFYYIVKTFLNFVRFYYKQKPDIIITRLGPIPLLQYFISCFFGKKLFIKTMGRFWSENNKTTFKDKIYNKMVSYINIRIMRNSAGLDTVTKNFQSIFIEKYNIDARKISVVENAVDISDFYPFKTEKNWESIDFSAHFPILGYVGNLPSKRAMSQLLNIYDKIKLIYPKLAIMIVGMDNDLQRSIEIFKKDNKKIYCLGQIPYSLVPKAMNMMDVCYSFTTNHDLKEVGNSSQKLRQYIACGKPVITMKFTNEFVVNNNLGSLVNQEDMQEITEETLKWIKMVEQEGSALSHRLHQYAKEYLSAAETFRQRLEFWQSILSE